MVLRTTVLALLTALLTAAGPALGMGEPGVAALQVALRAKGMYDGTVDGVLGAGTTSAVSASSVVRSSWRMASRVRIRARRSVA